MRTLLAIIAVFSLSALRAQAPEPSYGLEKPRGAVRPYPTQQAASDNAGTNDAYFTRLGDWNRSENSFSAPFTVPFAWANRQVILHVDNASADYQVRVNGRTAAYNADGNTPAEFNLTRFIQEGRNTVEIVVSEPSATAKIESWKQNSTPQIGPAWIMSQPTLRIRDMVATTRENGGEVTAEVGIVVKSDALNPRTSRIHYELLTPAGKTAATGYKDLTLDMRREDTVRFLARIPDTLLWSTARPVQYTLRLRTQHEGRFAEYIEAPLGFRTLDLQQGQMAINGEPVTLRTREVEPSITAAEIAALRGKGVNTLRLLPGPAPESLYAVCDTMGMLVIVQAPIDSRGSGTSRRKGGTPSNDPAWRTAYTERAQNSYHTAKSHPSVVAFSLATHSANGICLYESYLNMKRFEDQRPIIYPDAAAEWNTDKLKTE